MGIDPIGFLLRFQGMNGNEGNSFSIVFKRDCHLSYFSCIASTRDRDAMVRGGIKESFFRTLVNPPRERFRNLAQGEAKAEMVSIPNVSSLFCGPHLRHTNASSSAFASCKSLVSKPSVNQP